MWWLKMYSNVFTWMYVIVWNRLVQLCRIFVDWYLKSCRFSSRNNKFWLLNASVNYLIWCQSSLRQCRLDEQTHTQLRWNSLWNVCKKSKVKKGYRNEIQAERRQRDNKKLNLTIACTKCVRVQWIYVGFGISDASIERINTKTSIFVLTNDASSP